MDEVNLMEMTFYMSLACPFLLLVTRTKYMSAHIRTVLTNPDLTVPVSNGRCDLGIWQGVYLWEHRTHSHQRRVIVTVQGD